ncbi:MAG: MFS transporter [Actinomycetota bacterium]|jgi:fucose permease
MTATSPLACAMADLLMRPAGRRRRAFLAVLALLGFVAIGLPEGALGVAWPSIRATFGVPLSALGGLLAVYTAGYLAASLASGRVMARAGIGRQLAGATAIGTAGFAVTAAAPGWGALLAGAVLVGVAGGTLDAAINTYVAIHHGLRSLSLLHAAYGVGATAAPLALTAVLHSGGSWRGAYAGLVVFESAVVAGFFTTRRDWDEPAPAASGVPREADGPSPPAAARRATAVLVLMFFVAVGVEATAGQWAFSLLTVERGVSLATAGAWTGGFWASLTAGRLVVGAFGSRLVPDQILGVAVAGIVAGAVLLWWSPTPALGAAGLLVIGFTEAAVFPTLVAVTPARVGAERAPAVIGYQVAAAAIGGAAVPALTGVAADVATLEVVGPVLLAGGIALAVLSRA